MIWHIENDILCIALAAVILIDYKDKPDSSRLRDKLFRSCLAIDIMACFFEITSSLVMGFPVSNLIFHLFTVPYYAVMVGAIILWYGYTACILFEDDDNKVRLSLTLGSALYVAYLLFLVVSISTDLFYSLDAVGNYSRGPLFFVPVVIFLIYTLSIISMVARHGKRIRDRHLAFYLIMLPALIAVGMIPQYTIPGWITILPTYSLALLIAYLAIQNQKNQRVMERLVSAADTDMMTGLMNRACAERELDEALLARPQALCALMIIDLDDLKHINDTYGHPVGDEAIRKAATTLKDCFRSTDVVARIGGDEFAVFLADINDAAILDLMMNKVLDRFMRVETGTELHPHVPLRCSIGAALSVCGETDRYTLYKKADTALYYAKRAGKFCYRVFSEDMEMLDNNAKNH